MYNVKCSFMLFKKRVNTGGDKYDLVCEKKRV